MRLKQDIRFCTCKDGVRLAIPATGSGLPLVLVFNWLTDIERDLTSVDDLHQFRGLPFLRGLFGGLARGLLVREASPQVLEQAQGLLKAVEIGWGSNDPSFRQGFVHRMFRDANSEQLRAFDQVQRNMISGVNATRFLKNGFHIGIQDLARQVRCPALVAQTKDDPLLPFSEGVLLASLIPDSRFVPIYGSNHIPFKSDSARPLFLAELRAFLSVVSSLRSIAANPAAKASVLTPRQRQILQAVTQGQTAKQIARTLNLSLRTVQIHVTRVLATLQCSSRAEAVLKAIKPGLLA